jgi:hypothetical protein
MHMFCGRRMSQDRSADVFASSQRSSSRQACWVRLHVKQLQDSMHLLGRRQCSCTWQQPQVGRRWLLGRGQPDKLCSERRRCSCVQAFLAVDIGSQHLQWMGG